MAETMPPPLPADAREPVPPEPGDEGDTRFAGEAEAGRLKREIGAKQRQERMRKLEEMAAADQKAQLEKARKIAERLKAEGLEKPKKEPGIPERLDKWVEDLDTKKGLKKTGKGVGIAALFLGAAVGTALRWPVKKAYHAADWAASKVESFFYDLLPGPLKKMLDKPRKTAGEEADEEESKKKKKGDKK